MHPWASTREVYPWATNLRTDYDLHVHRVRMRWSRYIQATRPTNVRIRPAVPGTDTYKLGVGKYKIAKFLRDVRRTGPTPAPQLRINAGLRLHT